MLSAAFHTAPSPGSLANVMAEFDAAVRHLGVNPDIAERLREPRCSLKLSLPVQRDDGHIASFRAYHTIHSYLRGPAIGGVQFRPDVTLETVEAIAFWSMHRCAVVGIPFGGSASAIICDPALLSNAELERLARRYVAELADTVHPDANVLTADIGTNQQIMCWCMDTYNSHTRTFVPGIVLGKPADIGGASFSTNPAALGIELCIRKSCAHLKLPLAGARVALQGFGKVGKALAQLLAAAGARIVGIADISGAYVNEHGIDVQKTVWHQESYGMLDGLEGSVRVDKLDDPRDLFALDVDILVLAAIELQITEDNMARVKARLIAEVAHDPVSPEADRYLHAKGITIIPDVLCNSGGVTGYYCEWVQNRLGYYWSRERADQEVQTLVGRAFDAVSAHAAADGIPLRLAAAAEAVKRLAATAQLRGIYA